MSETVKIQTASPPLSFTWEDACKAAKEWNCNCGPSALAACLGLSLDQVREKLTDFESKGYMNPTMMEQAIHACGFRIASEKRNVKENVHLAIFPVKGLVRIQWTGPWTAPHANGRWAYRHTHWVHCRWWNESLWIFDINGGIQPYRRWQYEIVPMITKSIPRSDGGWYPTHIWSIANQKTEFNHESGA